MKSYFRDLLNRPVRSIIHFNDVFGHPYGDFDAQLTTTFRNLGVLSDMHIATGGNIRIADYGVNLVNDLVAEENRIRKHFRLKIPQGAIQVIANFAPRNTETTQGGKNGRDFHLAITVEGVEIIAVPLEHLQALEMRNQILALYRIPNQALTVTDGDKEQFRSSIIGTTRYCPQILEPIFEYDTEIDMVLAKQKGLHPPYIPEQDRLAQVAFVDAFGNVRLSVWDNHEFMRNLPSQYGSQVTLRVNDQSCQAKYVTSLKNIPTGELGIYQNVADHTSSSACYWELVKKSPDCNHEPRSAAQILTEMTSHIWEAEISLDPVQNEE